jgi:hypothetical protein
VGSLALMADAFHMVSTTLQTRIFQTGPLQSVSDLICQLSQEIGTEEMLMLMLTAI